jgi:protein involved in polysaccharide export with SLBB domain
MGITGKLYFAPTTPSVPTSATAQENTNPYAVDVYVYGGDVTEIQITKGGTAYTVFSVSTAIAMSGQAYKLNPGDSITVTYSTAPTWEWLSD